MFLAVIPAKREDLIFKAMDSDYSGMTTKMDFLKSRYVKGRSLNFNLTSIELATDQDIVDESRYGP